MMKVHKIVLALLIAAALGSPLFAQSAPAAAGSNLTIGLLMALPVVPKLKITDKGLVDVERFTPVELFV